jgi:tRNA dimethylallyltransferase
MSTRKSSETVKAAAGTRPPLALIAGPTASGKSDLALELGLALARSGRGAVIVNADSAQLYADLPILSAAPAPDALAAVPHRLYGAWEGATGCSAADWAEQAKAVIAEAHAGGGVPILVGGTGLYIRTLLEGIAPVPAIDPEIRRTVREMPVAEAHAALLLDDPARAAALAPADAARIMRALEVIRSTGRTLAQWQEQRVGGIGASVALHPAVLLPDRAFLYARCDTRFAAMLAAGAVEEVAALLARDLDPALPVMRAIGVSEIAGYLRGDYPLEEAGRRGAQATRNYAKRQYTWLRHQPPALWPRLEENHFSANSIFETLLSF